LLKKKNISAAELDELEAQVEEEVAKAVEFAEASPEPTLEDLYTDIYAD
jgi:TPP-dependent pyruvate/acetoin dehydrogenase alpha subunit